MKTNKEILENIDDSIMTLACRNLAQKQGEEIELALSKYDRFENSNTKKIRRAIFRQKSKNTVWKISKKAPMFFSILFAIVFVFSACALSSPAIMTAIGHLVLDKYETHTNIKIEDGDYAINLLTDGYNFPTYAPQGYALMDIRVDTKVMTSSFYKEETDETFFFDISADGAAIMLDTENVDEYVEKEFLEGEYLYVRKGKHSSCVFMKGSMLYEIYGNLSDNDCQKMIESFKLKRN